MKKTKKEKTLISELKKIHASMKQIVLDAGIQEPQFNYAIKNLEKQTEEYQSILLGWMINFKCNEYASVFKLLSEFSGWKYLKDNNINSFPEQILLRKKQKTLREAWHKRPRPQTKKVIKK